MSKLKKAHKIVSRLMAVLAFLPVVIKGIETAVLIARAVTRTREEE